MPLFGGCEFVVDDTLPPYAPIRPLSGRVIAMHPEVHEALLSFEAAVPMLVDGVAAMARVLADAFTKAAEEMEAFARALREVADGTATEPSPQ
jgi:hypothetical protein